MKLHISQRVVVAVDVTGFGRSSEPARGLLRRALYEAVQAALDNVEAGLDRRVRQSDTGDGLLLLMPAATDVSDAAVQFPTALHDLLLRNNEASVAEARLRVRAAVHVGEVEDDAAGWHGDAVRQAVQIADAGPVRLALRRAPNAALVLAVADPVYQAVRQDRRYSEAFDTFERFVVPAKAAEITGWVGVPRPDPPSLYGDGPESSTESGWNAPSIEGPPPGPDFPTDR